MPTGRRSLLSSCVALSVLVSLLLIGLPTAAPARHGDRARSVSTEPPPPSDPPSPQRGHGDPSGDAEPAKVAPEPSSGDIASLRTENSRTYPDPAGGHVAWIYQGPVNFKDAAGDWQRIQNDLVPTSVPGYAYENQANAYHVLLPSSLSDAPVKFQLGDEWVSFSLQHASGSLGVAGGRAIYAHALAGADVVYEASNEQVVETVRLHSAASAHALTFDVKTSPGLTARANDRGGIDLVDLLGRRAFSFSPPTMHDSAARPAAGPVAMNLSSDFGGTTVDLVPDDAWLEKPGRTWPVEIDPSVTIQPPTQDCTISSNGSGSQCTDTSLSTGFDGTNKNRMLMQFDLSSIPSQQVIQNVQLNVYLTGSSTSNLVEWGLYRVFPNTWTNAATWSTYDGTNAWTAPGGDFGADPWDERFYAGGTAGWRSFYPTGLVQYWKDNSVPNQGFLVKPEFEDSGNVNVLTFVSAESTDTTHRPTLIVNYDDRTGEQGYFKFYAQGLDDSMDLKVNVANGNFIVHNTDLRIGGIGQDLVLQRWFNDLYSTQHGPYAWGNGWVATHTWVYLSCFSDGSCTFQGPSGYRIPFVSQGDGTFFSPPHIKADLHQWPDATYTLTWHNSGTTYDFDAGGDLTSISDRNDNTVTMHYGANGFVDQITDTEGRITTFTYTTIAGAPRVTQVQDPAGRQYVYGYSATTGDLTSYQDPQNGAAAKTLYGYDASENLTSITTPRGLQVALTYDTSFRVKTITYTCPLAICNPVKSHQWQFTYNSGNTVVKDPLLNATTFTFDGASRVTDITDANMKQQKLVYNGDNNVKNYRDQVGYDLDDPHNWSGEFNATSPEVMEGVVLPLAGASAAAVRYTYDDTRTDFQRYFPISVKNVGTTVWTFAYNCKHNLKTATDTIGAGNTFTYHYYDGCTGDGDPAQVIGGLPSSVIDARMKTTSFNYTLSGQVLTSATVTPPAPQGSSTATFDSNTGRLASVVAGNDHKRVFTYDNLDRVTRIDFYLHSADPSPTSSITYAYDADGNLTQRVDGTGTTTFEYKDPYGRQTKKVAGTTTFTYTYDGVNLKTLVDPSGTTTYTYNTRNLVTTVKEPNNKITTFDYDVAGHRVYTKFPSSVRVYTGYDGAGRVCNIAASTTVLSPLPGGKNQFLSCSQTVSGTILGYKYAFDDPGTPGTDTLLRQSVTDQAGNKATYSYDEDLRLDQVVNTGSPSNAFTYNYDGNGNMTSLVNSSPSSTTSFVYDDASELCWSGTSAPPANCSSANYTYDGAGNELTSPKYTFAYNEKDQTTSVTPTGGSAVAMAYANRGQAQRISWGTRTFAYGQLGLDVDKPPSGSTVYYNHDPGGGLIGERIGTTSYYYVTDGLGSVMGVFSASSSVAVNTYKYDPWGAQTSSTGTTYNHWRYAQGFADDYPDSTKTLLKFGTRYYDSTTMRWTQPEAGAGYIYVGDNPVNATDPTGLVEEPFGGDRFVAGGGGGGGGGSFSVGGCAVACFNLVENARGRLHASGGVCCGLRGITAMYWFGEPKEEISTSFGGCAFFVCLGANVSRQGHWTLGVGLSFPGFGAWWTDPTVDADTGIDTGFDSSMWGMIASVF